MDERQKDLSNYQFSEGKESLEASTFLLRIKVLQAEQERLDGAKAISVAEARRRLRERLNQI